MRSCWYNFVQHVVVLAIQISIIKGVFSGNMASYRVVIGRCKVCIIDQLTILCFPSYSSINVVDNDISGWLRIVQWKWLVTSITVCSICWFFYQIIFMWRHSRVPMQARSAGYIPCDSFSIRHPWWVHLTEKLIIWWNTHHATGPKWWFLILRNIYVGIQDACLLLSLTQYLRYCGSSDCTTLQ